MAAVASITLNDAATTPVAHVFNPIGPDTNGVWWWEETGVALATLGNYRISAALTRAPNPAPGSNSSDRVNRVKVTLHLPTLETLGTNDQGLTPPPTIAYICRATGGEYILPDRSSLRNRQDLQKMNYELQNNSQIKAMICDLANVY